MVGNNWVIDAQFLKNAELLFSLRKDVPDQVRTSPKEKGPVVLSFFSGAMGLDIGLEKAGLHPLLASEIEPNARKTILLNRPNIGLIGDINNYSAEDVRRYAGLAKDEPIDLVVGGPPCQAFSTAGKHEAFHDKRGNVFLTFVDMILALQPRLAIIENVRGLLSAPYSLKHKDASSRAGKAHDSEKGGALWHIMQLLENGGYTVSFTLYNAANYGAPQKRERLVIFCSKDGKKIPYLNPTRSEDGSFNLPKWKTLREALTGLTDIGEYLTFPERRLRYYRLLKEGQYWKDLPKDLWREALGSKLDLGGGKTGFLRRLAWEKPSPTLVTDPTMPATDLCHPTEDRPLSINEYKRIQEFPDDWELFGCLKDKYRQIGNAVPVSLGYAIGKQAVAVLEGKPIQNPPEGFPFSRYVNTDDISFRAIMKNKIKTLEDS